MDSTRAIILPPGTFMYIVCANKHIYLFNNAVYFCAHASQVPWVEGRSPRPHEVLSSWAYQSQRRGRSLAAGAKRWMLLFLPPTPSQRRTRLPLTLWSPTHAHKARKVVCVCVCKYVFLTAKPADTQRKTPARRQHPFTRARQLTCHSHSLQGTHGHTEWTHRKIKNTTPIRYYFLYHVNRHNITRGLFPCDNLRNTEKSSASCLQFGRRSGDGLLTAPATRPYAPLNHAVLPPRCAPTSNCKHDGRHQVIFVQQQTSLTQCHVNVFSGESHYPKIIF